MNWGVKRAIKHVSWKTLASGVTVAVVGPAVARPILKSLIKTGMSLPDIWAQTRAEADRLRSEATAHAADDIPQSQMQTELDQLRRELAEIKAELANAKSS